jgi:uncharacterized DUF497 family protein
VKFRHVLWDDANRRHILADGDDHPEREVFEEDVEEVILERPHPTLEMETYEVGGEARTDLLGRTTYDRILFVTVAPQRAAAARPVSARDATEKERSTYESMMSQRKRRR